MTDTQRFEGTSSYIATEDLKVAVNAAVTLRRPLLVKGEPGTGKTVLAHEISRAIGAPLIEWNVKSTTKAQQGLYEYDAVARLRDGQLGEERVHDIRNYIKKGKLWEAFTAPELPVLLIDEIDKADIEFPNDLLQELDRMSFDVYETQERIEARERPIVVITSNNEKELPDAFLRRCFFHYIKFPDRETMQSIIDVHFPGIQKTLVKKAMDIFYELREVPGLALVDYVDRPVRVPALRAVEHRGDVGDQDRAVVHRLDDRARDRRRVGGHGEIAHHDFRRTGTQETAGAGARRFACGVVQFVETDIVCLHPERVGLDLDSFHPAAHVQHFRDAGDALQAALDRPVGQ